MGSPRGDLLTEGSLTRQFIDKRVPQSELIKTFAETGLRSSFYPRSIGGGGRGGTLLINIGGYHCVHFVLSCKPFSFDSCRKWVETPGPENLICNVFNGEHDHIIC